MNLDKSLAFYKDRFADASDFTFVFVGSFDLPTIKPLVERYLGSLPALHRKEAGRDVGIRPPAGVVEKDVTKGTTPKSQVGVVFTGPFQNNQRNRVIVRAMANTLAGNLQRVLQRGSGRDVRRQRRARLHEAADRGVPPDDHLRLRSGAHAGSGQGAVRRWWTSSGRTGRARARSRTRRRRCGATSRPTAGRTVTLLNQLAFAYQYDEPVPDPATLRGLYDQLTAPLLRDAARTYLDTNRYVKVVLMPEGK